MTTLLLLQEKAVDDEGLWREALLPSGVTLACKYQRPRYLRNHRIIPGSIESMRYTYRARNDGEDWQHIEGPWQAERLIAGVPLEEVCRTTSDGETGEDVLNRVWRTHV